MFSVSDKEENRDNGGYLLYEKLLSFDGSSENASQLDLGLWYTAGIWRKRCGFCTGRTGFWIIKKNSIQMETERSGCTRVRFTKPDKDGNVKQYIEKQDPRDIELKDLSGMESLAKADELMQQWAYETFDGDDIPMCVVYYAEAAGRI